MLDAPIARVENLRVEFQTKQGLVVGVEDVSFEINPGETVCVVGESGSGKSVSSLSLMRLVEFGGGKIADGRLLFDRKAEGVVDLAQTDQALMRSIRGNEIGMIFQEPMTALNPVFTVGDQIGETVRLHQGLDAEAARERSIEMLRRVGIPAPEQRVDEYPHQLSGGMRQRVMIAMAMACDPSLLIADEPTTALDVTIQAQILELMKDLQSKRPGSSTILITHDLAVVAETCDRVIVMYGGLIQEMATAKDLFDKPLHPYTRGLMGSIPHEDDRGKPLYAIPGNVPSIMDFPTGCRFCTRCDVVMDKCETVEPELREVAPGRMVRCHLDDLGAAANTEGN